MSSSPWASILFHCRASVLLSRLSNCSRGMGEQPEPSGSWLSVTPSLEHFLTEVSHETPLICGLDCTLNPLENCVRGPVRPYFIVRVSQILVIL